MTARLLLSLLPAGLVVAGAGLTYLTFRGRRRAATVAGTPRVDVADLSPSDGLVAVDGAARPRGGELLAADALGVDGVARVTTVERRRERGRDTGGYRTTTSAWTGAYASSAHVPFAVDDGTGTVPVEVPEGGTLTLETETFRVEEGEEPPAAVRRLCDAVDGLAPAPSETRRYEQGVVEPGERVVVLGEPVAGDEEVILTGDRHADAFVVGDAPQETLAAAESYGVAGYLLGGVLAAAGAVVLAWLWLP